MRDKLKRKSIGGPDGIRTRDPLNAMHSRKPVTIVTWTALQRKGSPEPPLVLTP